MNFKKLVHLLKMVVPSLTVSRFKKNFINNNEIKINYKIFFIQIFKWYKY